MNTHSLHRGDRNAFKKEGESKRLNNAQLLVDDFVLLLARLDSVLRRQLHHRFKLGVRVGVLDLATIVAAIVLLLLCAHCCLAWVVKGFAWAENA